MNLREPHAQICEFQAYFTNESISDLSLSTDNGVIDETMKESVAIPLEVVFVPKMYGKLTKGTLVVETKEVQWMIAVTGKMPDYVPPVVSKGAIDSQMPESHKVSLRASTRRKRNIIRENIENAKITKPLSSRRKKATFEI